MAINRSPYLFLAIFSLAQLWPWFLFYIGGDKPIYQFYMECFARTLLEGELRPSFCRFSNGGFGSLTFFFYFPLPYYIASLFYPLKWVGLNIEHLFIIQICLANLLFAVTSYTWLKRHTTPIYALAISCILLYLPYRMELLYYRAAHTELFAIALLPLWLIGLERLIENTKRWHMLACIVGITALTHTHTAFIFGIISVLYASFYTKNIASLFSITTAGIIGLCVAAYFLIPAAHYQQFILGADGGVNYTKAAVNRYPMLQDLLHPIRVRLIVLTLCSLLMVGALCWLTFKRTPNQTATYHIRAWLLTFLICAILYSPLIAPLFDNSAFIRSIFFPWRMQVVFIPLIAVLLIYYTSYTQKKTRMGDMLIALAFLNLLQAFTMQVVLPGQDEKQRYIVEELIRPNREYFSIWTPKDLPNESFLVSRPPKVISGKANIISHHAFANRITLNIQAEEHSQIHLRQTYFPSWRAHTDHMPLKITPDTTTGETLIDVPRGNHRITLKNKPYAHGPWYVQLSPWVSLAAIIAILLGWRRTTRLD